MQRILLAKRRVTLLRGRLDGLEIALSGPDLDEALVELEARLAEQPSFYRGASAVVNFGDNAPSETDVTRLRSVLQGAGIEFRALSGTAPGLDELARAQSLQYEQVESQLSDSARSLVADFAGARDDIAQRRRRGEASVRRPRFDPVEAPRPVELRLVDAAPTTLYHAATLRGGQTLHHNGNIVVVGDVNPGAELVATGDILVFGRLAGTAHAGAQGNAEARIYALDLAATQLRIATVIAAEEAGRRDAPRAEAAVVREGQIAIVALDRLGDFQTRGASLA
jgi:septum site-determining protein MinC